MIEQSLYNALVGSAAVTALCANRIYPVQLPEQATMPAIEYQFISAVSAATLTSSGMFRTRVQIGCWGNNYGDAAKLRAAVLDLLDGYVSPATDETRIQNSLIVNAKRDDFDHELLMYRCMCEFYLLHIHT